jgi:hypothetical protein
LLDTSIFQAFSLVLHSGTASRKTRARTRAPKLPSLTTSTLMSRSSFRSYQSPPRSKRLRPRLKTDEQIDIALRPGIAPGNTAEHAHVVGAMRGGEGKDILAPGAQRIVCLC